MRSCWACWAFCRKIGQEMFEGTKTIDPTTENSTQTRSSWMQRETTAEEEMKPLRGESPPTHIHFLSRSVDYLRRRCPVLQVRSCRCDCRQKTSHWKREGSREGAERGHTCTSASDSVVLLGSAKNNSSPNGIMRQNLISTQPSVWQIHHFSVCPMRGLSYDWVVCQNNTGNIILDGAVFHRILRCPDCCFGVI